MKIAALKHLFAKQDIAERVFMPTYHSFRSRVNCTKSIYEEHYRNCNETGECFSIRGVRKWGKEIAHIVFKGGAIIVVQNKRNFRVCRQSGESNIYIVAAGLLMRSRYRMTIAGCIDIRTGKERGFPPLSPEIDFKITHGDSVLSGAINSSEFPGSGVFGRLKSNRFCSVNLREQEIMWEHFGNDENYAIATALLLWVIRDTRGL